MPAKGNCQYQVPWLQVSIYLGIRANLKLWFFILHFLNGTHKMWSLHIDIHTNVAHSCNLNAVKIEFEYKCNMYRHRIEVQHVQTPWQNEIVSEVQVSDMTLTLATSESSQLYVHTYIHACIWWVICTCVCAFAHVCVSHGLFLCACV
jgi:hypothetical protein